MTLTRLTFRSLFFFAAGLIFSIATAGIPNAQVKDSGTPPPHLDQAGVAGYREFLTGGHHKAFAIAPGGAWAWVSDMPDPDVAESEAIRTCSGYTNQNCKVYAVDGQVVLDDDAWAAAWGPYAGSDTAASQPVGTIRGRRFPDLLLTTPDGEPVKISDLGGKIVFLHFWGSWCAPCQFEFPELQGLYDSLKEEEGIAFVLVQAREDINRSRRWAQQRKFAMPFYDSGARSPSDRDLTTADGGIIADRVVAPRFPATYILDSHGLVMFSRFSPPDHWSEYEPLLRHAIAHRPD
ncbi:MAG: redoxin domain-containing protein [Alphaproteobacteria bacterium]|nr:redoxin domain-containing protein [Alphaproteobacteria bacterium]